MKRVSPESAFASLLGEVPPPVGMDIGGAGMTVAGEERFVKRVLSALESVSPLSALLEATPLAGVGVCEAERFVKRISLDAESVSLLAAALLEVTPLAVV